MRASRSDSSSAPAPPAATTSYSRLLARHIGRHIPGNPNVIAGEYARRRRHPRRDLRRQDRSAGRHDPVDRQPGPAGRPGARTEHDVSVRPSRLPLDRQCLVLQPDPGHVAYLANQDVRRSHEAGDGDRLEPGGFDLDAASGRAQQHRRHEDQDRLWLSGRRRHQHRDGARRGRRPRGEPVGQLCRQPSTLHRKEADQSRSSRSDCARNPICPMCR